MSGVSGGIQGLDLLPSSIDLLEVQDSIPMINQKSHFAQSPITVLAFYLTQDKGKEQLSSILHKYDITVLKEIARRYTPDSRGYVYKWTDADKVINYIVERAENLSTKGSVFVTD